MSDYKGVALIIDEWLYLKVKNALTVLKDAFLVFHLLHMVYGIVVNLKTTVTRKSYNSYYVLITS